MTTMATMSRAELRRERKRAAEARERLRRAVAECVALGELDAEKAREYFGPDILRARAGRRPEVAR
jgi:polyhydroxyalkanoate synthesis regulator phasin